MMGLPENNLYSSGDGWLARIIAFCLQNRLVVLLAVLAMICWGLITAPFDWNLKFLPRDPIAVDALPDLGENQQIVFTEWPGRSPQDIEDQITYPLTSALLGIPGVKSVRSSSMFGFSNIFIIFSEDVEFYWSRTRILEKLNSLPAGALPEGVKPTMGPDATPLGQVFWYTLEGRDPEGASTGGWDLDELRSIQDWLVRYELMAVPGVAEVGSIGGFVKEYQVDVDPYAMIAKGVNLTQVIMALKNSNLDTGARTMEINRVEYVIRGLGLVKNISDLEEAVVTETDNIPLRVKDIARVSLGPALRRGALDKSGAEAVGGVVVVRYGANPLEVIQWVKDKIAAFSQSLPQKTVPVRNSDGSVREAVSQVKVVPFYDRTGLIHETLGTLNRALVEEILVTIIVVVVMLMHFGSSMLISGLLPLAVLMCFIAMKIFGVDANIVALSGIAIAIGTMVDMGIVLNENILKHMEAADKDASPIQTIYQATIEVGSAVLTAVLTTVISFLPIFTMEMAEGKLFKPLAYTKTFALVASLIVALTIIPPVALTIFRKRKKLSKYAFILIELLFPVALYTLYFLESWLLFVILILLAIYLIIQGWLPEKVRSILRRTANYLAVAVVAVFLTSRWQPLGIEHGVVRNLIFVAVIIGGFLFLIHLFHKGYPQMLHWCLANKSKFLLIPIILVLFGATIWLGFNSVFSFIPAIGNKIGIGETIRLSSPWAWASHRFPGLGKEFMPDFDEGSFLLMPTTMPHASIGEAMDVLQKQDMALNALPEVSLAVGKIGRVDSPLDPAPVSMIETVINYHPEYLADSSGKKLAFVYASDQTDLFRNPSGDPVMAPDGEPYTVLGKFSRDESGVLIPDPGGSPFRIWRPVLDPQINPGREEWAGINSPDDIWEEILRVTEISGTTSAPKLQPIAARQVMLQSGMRAPMGIKILGKGQASLEDLEAVGLELEKYLQQVPSIKANTVNAERVVGKPYLEIKIDRLAIQRYNLTVAEVQNVIQAAIGGMPITTTVEGRERYQVRIRYQRELRDSIEDLERILVSNRKGLQVPLKELIEERKIQYRRGPQSIKSEDSSLVSYVLFDKQSGYAEVDVVNAAREFLQSRIEAGELILPAGVTYKFAGSYENQIRSEKKLMVVLPLALLIIFFILYFQFKSGSTTLFVFSGIFVAAAGGFIMLWLYGEGWFLNFSIFGTNLRDLFQMHPINLSVAIWVGFIALFGIATDNSVIIATYLDQTFAKQKPASIETIREATVTAGMRRIRPCLMTTATTILALLPVLTSTGRGADIMIPMAIPVFGGMILTLITAFIVPVLYCGLKETKSKNLSP
ncbi:MAG: efflux RND transporter permease subunit [Planctomycetes bacterium]|nr:efflux RND transporter permease subunit [Planctomycetota bacterium]